MNLKYFFTILLIFISFQLIGQSGIIEGRVLNVANNEPLPFTNIIIYGTNKGVTTDIDGKFIITGVNPGYVRLAVSAVGFESKITEDFMVTNAKAAYIDIYLKSTLIELDIVEIKATPFVKDEESPLSMRVLSISELERNPGGNRDVSKIIQSLPGVASTPAYRNDIIVRGGGSSENRFYLDGIEIPNINHFATQGASGGPAGIINLDFVREVDFYSGAFPASRGNALSSVLEIKQIEGNNKKLNFRGAFGASDLALTLDGPAGKNSTFIFSARRSYLQFLFGVLGLPFLPTYNDFQGKYKVKFGSKSELSVIGLGAIDVMTLNTGIKNPDESQRYRLAYLPYIEQWSYTIGAAYKVYHKKGFDTWIISRNMLNNKQYKYFNNDDSKSSNKILDYNSFETGNKLRFEHTTIDDPWKINYGAGTEYGRYYNSTYQKSFSSGEPKVFEYESSLDVYKWDAFGQLSRNFLNNKLSTSLGIRMDGNSYTKQMANPLNQLSPRFSASYLLTEVFSVNFNTGRYYQMPAYTTLGYRDNNNVLVNKYNGLKYIYADHLVGGLEFRPDINSKITVEGFYKKYSNYPFSVRDSNSLANKGADFGTFGDEEVISIGKGRAYGFEVLIWDKDFYKTNFIVSYTYVRSEFTDYKNDFIPSAWDNIHLLNITATREFKRNWQVGFKWRYVGGSPYTPWDYEKSSLVQAWDVQSRGYYDYANYNSLRNKAFHQLDIRVDKEYFFDKWSLMLYVDIQNIYNFKAISQDALTNLDANGNMTIVNPYAPLEEQRYYLYNLKNESGNILPTIGFIVEF